MTGAICKAAIVAEALQLLHALRAFEAVARLGSVKSAAQELNVTDGAVSHQIKALENALNVELFVRAHRRLELTPHANDFATSVSTAFEAISRAAEKLEQSAKSSHLVIAAPSTFLVRWLIPRLPQLEARLKGTTVRPVTWNRDVAISDRSVDIFVTVGSDQPVLGMTHRRIGPETFGPVVAPHLWKHSEPSDKVLQLRRLGTNWPPAMWRNWAKESGHSIQNEEIIRYERLLFAIEAAEAGLGPVVAPGPAVIDALRDGRLVAPFGMHVRDGYWSLAWRTEQSSGLIMSVYRWFLKEFAESGLHFSAFEAEDD